MIPLAGSIFWGPMAITIMGGLLVATALTLLVVPALYALWFRVHSDETVDAPALNPRRCTPSAAHFLKSHQLLVQKFAADRDRQRSSFETGATLRRARTLWRLLPRAGGGGEF
jgi:hypothetical protein